MCLFGLERCACGTTPKITAWWCWRATRRRCEVCCGTARFRICSSAAAGTTASGYGTSGTVPASTPCSTMAGTFTVITYSAVKCCVPGHAFSVRLKCMSLRVCIALVHVLFCALLLCRTDVTPGQTFCLCVLFPWLDGARVVTHASPATHRAKPHCWQRLGWCAIKPR